MSLPDNAIALVPIDDRSAAMPTQDDVLEAAYDENNVRWDQIRKTISKYFDIRLETLDYERKIRIQNDPTHPAYPAATGPDLTQNPTSATEPSTALAGQNNIAEAISKEIEHILIYDVTAQAWFQKSGCIWLQVIDAVARQRISASLKTRLDSFSFSYLSGISHFLRDMNAVGEWTCNNDEIPLKNGIYSLPTKSCRDYSAADFYNWQLPYGHDKNATCPMITASLKQWAGGSDELYHFLLCWLFCVLTRRHRLQVYLELIGPGGTGKSSFMSLCTLLVGETNMTVTELKQLESNRFEAAALYGKLLVLVTDSEQHRGEVAQLKKITGGDPIRNEVKNKQQAQPFIFMGMVMIAANEPIASKDYTSGLSRRRRPVYFLNRLTDDDKAKFQNEPNGINSVFEREMPGLLNLLSRLDAKDAEKTILNPCHAIATNALEAEIDTNPILAWADDYLLTCDKGKGAESNIGRANDCPNTKLYPSYIKWSEGQNREPVSCIRFSNLLADQLEAKGISTERTRTGGGRFLKGIKLRRFTDKEPTLITKKGME